MENFRHLVEVLKSQVNLYSELSDLMASEKEAIVSWSIDKTVEITKKKDALLRKEHIQGEARNALLSKIASDRNLPSVKISDIIDIAKDEAPETADELINLRDRILELITQIHAENISLRMLYATNNRLITDFFTQTGLVNYSAGGYGQYGRNKMVTTVQKLV